MALEYEIRGGELLWIKNPVTGVVSYIVDLRAKSFAFTLAAREGGEPGASYKAPPTVEELIAATAACPFCPGNEDQAPAELFRVAPQRVPNWGGGSARAQWVIRVFNNLFPRIPEELTGNRNESYVVVEDPRHFLEHPRSLDDLLFTGALDEEHFCQLLLADAEVTRAALNNPAVGSVVIRKNQGRESGASQPHIHQQIIGSSSALPALAAEAAADRQDSAIWRELIGLFERLGLVIERDNGVVSYASPIGTFPRSYDVVMPDYRGLLHELGVQDLRCFAGAIHRLLRVLGRIPLDYEIHQGEGLPLHAHINSRIYPYSSVAGTLNVPHTLLESSAAIRKALSRGR